MPQGWRGTERDRNRERQRQGEVGKELDSLQIIEKSTPALQSPLHRWSHVPNSGLLIKVKSLFLKMHRDTEQHFTCFRGIQQHPVPPGGPLPPRPQESGYTGVFSPISSENSRLLCKDVRSEV